MPPLNTNKARRVCTFICLLLLQQIRLEQQIACWFMLQLGHQQLLQQLSAKRRREWWVKPRSSHWREVILPSSALMSDADFAKNFRMKRSTFQVLLNVLAPHITGQISRYRRPVPADLRLLMFLYYVCQGASMNSVSNQFGYGRSTVSKVCFIVCEAILEVMYDDYIKWPNTTEMIRIASAFEEKNKIPQCTGCIDGCHIPIVQPRVCGKDYYNRKQFYSLIVQAVVDHKRRFIDLVVGWPGSVNDGRVWRCCSLKRRMEDLLGQCVDRTIPTGMAENGQLKQSAIPMLILGDSAYANSKRMVSTYEMTQVRRNNVIKELNGRLAGMRYVVECAFGILKARFRILLSPLMAGRDDPRRASILILALCMMHVFLIDQGDSYDVNDEEVQQILLDYRRKYPEPNQHNREEQDDTDSDDDEDNPRNTSDKIFNYISHRRNMREIRMNEE